MQKIIILIFLGTFVISCAPNTIVHKTYNRKLINSVNHFPSCGHISLIKEGDIKVYNDSLSKVSGKILDSIVRINESFPVVALHLDSIELILFNNQIIEMFNSILTKNTISTITIPQLILDKMEGYDQRFYMATLIEGFSRSGANYAGQ